MKTFKHGFVLCGLLIGLVGSSYAELVDKRVGTQKSTTYDDLEFEDDPSYSNGMPSFSRVPTLIKVDTAYLLEPVVGFGEDIPIEVALRQILPDMMLNDERDMKKTLVSWKSDGGTRKDALRSIRSFEKNLVMVVDGSKSHVYLMQRKEGKRFASIVEDKLWRVAVTDARLDKSLARWAKEAGFSFRWDADRHVLVSASSEFRGSLEAAVNELLSTPGIKNSDYPLEACIYSNSPPLLRVTRLGDQTNQCR